MFQSSVYDSDKTGRILPCSYRLCNVRAYHGVMVYYLPTEESDDHKSWMVDPGWFLVPGLLCGCCKVLADIVNVIKYFTAQ